MGDWNANSHCCDKTTKKDARVKIMEGWMVGTGWTIILGKC